MAKWPWSRTSRRTRQPRKVSKARREDRRDKLLHDELVKRFTEDDDFRVAYVEKCRGLKVSMVPIVQEKSVEDRIWEEALENDPDLKQRIVEARARQEELKGGSPVKRQVDEMAVQVLASRQDLLLAAAEKRMAAELDNLAGADSLEDLMTQLKRIVASKKRLGTRR